MYASRLRWTWLDEGELKTALRLSQERGDVASLLLPAEDWLFDYYAKAVSYAPIPVAVTTTSFNAVLSESDPECEGATLVEYLTAVERTNKAPQLLHSPALWRVVTEDYPTSEGYVLREHRTAEGKVNGALFYVGAGGRSRCTSCLRTLCGARSLASRAVPFGEEGELLSSS